MIVDSSAIMAIIHEEPDAAHFLGRIVGADLPLMSAGNWVELAAVLTRSASAAAWDTTEQLITASGIKIEPVTIEQAAIARDAYRRYGRGSGHPAALNFGDCFAYALAKATEKPLLFKGDDFARTDIVPAF
jgi:ribonuclease VapC